VCTSTSRSARREEEKNSTGTRNLQCNKLSLLSSRLHLFSLVALSLSLLCRHLRKSWTEVYFKKQSPDLTILCRPQPRQLSDHNSLLFRLISLFVNPYICLWPRTLCQETNSVYSFTFIVIIPFSHKIEIFLGSLIKRSPCMWTRCRTSLWRP
jgi:hypothetical protein